MQFSDAVRSDMAENLSVGGGERYRQPAEQRRLYVAHGSAATGEPCVNRLLGAGARATGGDGRERRRRYARPLVPQRRFASRSPVPRSRAVQTTARAEVEASRLQSCLFQRLVRRVRSIGIRAENIPDSAW